MAERDAILLVDDDPEAIRLLGEHLEAEGYLVPVARTGGDGLRLLRERPVTLLLLDSDIEENAPTERGVTDRLYGGDEDHRLRQEMLLGIGAHAAHSF